MLNKKQLSEEELEKVNGGFDCIKRNDLENKINQIVNFQIPSEGINCNIRIIKINAHCNTYYSRFHVYAYASDELSYNTLNSKRLESDYVGLWDCDGVNPQDSGLGYGQKGFHIRFEDGDGVLFYSVS